MRALMLLIVLAIAGCARHACTAPGCVDEVTLSINDARASGDGTYVFDLEADSYRWAQRCTVSGSTSCTVSGNAPPDQASVTTVQNGGTWVVAIAGTPAQVKVTVGKNGVVIGSSSVMPEYSTKYPNGADCPAGCDQATAVVVLQ